VSHAAVCPFALAEPCAGYFGSPKLYVVCLILLLLAFAPKRYGSGAYSMGHLAVGKPLLVIRLALPEKVRSCPAAAPLNLRRTELRYWRTWKSVRFASTPGAGAWRSQ